MHPALNVSVSGALQRGVVFRVVFLPNAKGPGYSLYHEHVMYIDNPLLRWHFWRRSISQIWFSLVYKKIGCFQNISFWNFSIHSILNCTKPWNKSCIKTDFSKERIFREWKTPKCRPCVKSENNFDLEMCNESFGSATYPQFQKTPNNCPMLRRLARWNAPFSVGL
jgi:hypothetical protein